MTIARNDTDEESFMVSPSRLMLFLPIVGALCALSTPNMFPQETQPAQPQHVKSASNSAPQDEIPSFVSFINTIGKLNEFEQRNLASGVEPEFPIANWPKKMTHLCPVREDDLEMAFAISLDTYQRVRDHDRESEEYEERWNRDPSRENWAALEDFNKLRFPIYISGIRSIKEELGEESFAKLGSCITSMYGPGTVRGPFTASPVPPEARPTKQN
jgi:hypothetical protein